MQKIDPAISANLPASVREVVGLVQAGVDEPVIKAFIEKASGTTYDLSADQIIYLNDIGIPSGLVAAMLEQGAKVRAETAKAAAASEAAKAALAQAAAAAAAQPAAAPAPVADPVAPAPAEPSVVYTVPTYVTGTATTFYAPLSPYGTWINHADFGWCWQPQVVIANPRWRPYGDRGHWVWSDCGWYWQSDYSWGWAPFHYGRWQEDARCGWVWVPGTTWSSAWVIWRSSGDYCGWAPLPPHANYVAGSGFFHGGVAVGVSFEFGLSAHHYTFMPIRHLADRNPHRYFASTGQAPTIFNQTVVVNNYGSRNNTVINNGVDVDRVAALTHREIHRVPIREMSEARNPAIRPDRVEQEGKEPVIYRGPLPTPGTTRNNSVATTGVTPARTAPTGRRNPEITPRSPTEDRGVSILRTEPLSRGQPRNAETPAAQNGSSPFRVAGVKQEDTQPQSVRSPAPAPAVSAPPQSAQPQPAVISPRGVQKPEPVANVPRPVTVAPTPVQQPQPVIRQTPPINPQSVERRELRQPTEEPQRRHGPEAAPYVNPAPQRQAPVSQPAPAPRAPAYTPAPTPPSRGDNRSPDGRGPDGRRSP